MKKIISFFVVLSFLTPITIFAAISAQGPYIGGQLGYVNPHNGNTDQVWVDSIFPIFSKSASRLYFGYRFNDNFAIEGGYGAYVHKSTISGSSSQYTKINGFDVSGKAILPIQFGFSIYLKAGGARIYQKINNVAPTYYSNVVKYRPLVGIGAGYNFNRIIAADLSITRIFGSGDLKNLDFIALGVTFTIPIK